MASIKWEECKNCGKTLRWDYSKPFDLGIGSSPEIRCPGCKVILKSAGKHWIDLTGEEKKDTFYAFIFLAIITSGVISFFPGLIFSSLIFDTVNWFKFGIGVMTFFIPLVLLQYRGYKRQIRESLRAKPNPDREFTQSDLDSFNSGLISHMLRKDPNLLKKKYFYGKRRH